MQVKEPRQTEQRRVVINKDSEIEYLAMGYKIPNFAHKDQVALSAISKILSGGKSSLFESEIIDKKHLASSISAYNMELKDDGVFFIMAQALPNVKAQTIEKEIYAILERLKKGQISPQELQKLKINTKASFIYGFEDASSSAYVFGDYLARGDLSPLFAYEEAINELSIEKIAQVARKYFDNKQLSVVILRK